MLFNPVLRRGSPHCDAQCDHLAQESITRNASWYVRRILPIAVLQTGNVVMMLGFVQVLVQRNKESDAFH